MRIMTKQDAQQVLAWRNHPDVRLFMFSRDEIALEDHLDWFENASQEAKRHLLIFEQGGVSRGFVNLLVSTGGIAEWGFYTDPFAPKGTGKALGEQLLFYTFSKLNVHKIFGQVLAYNERSRAFHLRLGFQQEGILRNHYFDGKQYFDIYSFGLLASEWLKNREQFDEATFY